MTYFVPLYAFMLVPVWIPLIAIAIGTVTDRLSPAEVTPAEAVVRDAKSRSLAVRPATRPSNSAERDLVAA